MEVNNNSDRNISQHHQKEEEDMDPFKVRLKFSFFDYLKMGIFGVTILPFKLLGMVICFLLAWILANIGMQGWDESKPVLGWRKVLQRGIGVLGRASMYFIGFRKVTIHGTQCTSEEAPILVVAPHSSFFDAIVIFCAGFPYFINRQENLNIPLLGKCMRFRQSIFVSREDPDSRQKTVNEMTRRVRSSDEWGQLVIFPEGATSNRKAILNFKPGGFIPGVPVQPILVKYPNLHDTISWTWDQPHGVLGCLFYSMTQTNLKVEVNFLPRYVPSEEEVSNAQMYADNVRKYMAKAAGVGLCDMTFQQIKDKYVNKEKSS